MLKVLPHSCQLLTHPVKTNIDILTGRGYTSMYSNISGNDLYVAAMIFFSKVIPLLFCMSSVNWYLELFFKAVCNAAIAICLSISIAASSFARSMETFLIPSTFNNSPCAFICHQQDDESVSKCQ